MEHFLIADRWTSVDPMNVKYGDDWGEDDVLDALQIIRAENRYHIRHRGDKPGGGIDGRTGIPLE